jgi:MoxR-like ATPase
MQRVARARAASLGRNYVIPDDIKALAQPVLAHRLLVTPEAQLQGITSADAVADVLTQVPVPTGATT